MARLSVGKAWDETSAFLASEMRLVAPVALAMFAIPSTVLGWANPPSPESGGGGSPLLTLLVLLIAIVGQLAIIRLALGWTGTIGEAIRVGFSRMPGALAAALMVYFPIALVGALVLIGLLGASQAENLENMTPKDLAAVPGVAWTILLCVIAFVVVAARTFPMLGVAVGEDSRPVHLVKRSWALTKGSFWRLLSLIALALIATMILSGAATLAVGAIATMIAGPASPFSLTALLTSLASGIVSAVVTTVYSVLVARTYLQLANG